ncbi:N-formylglutamate amidohydrolase [Aurantiacibacter sediminis]|uniref:N-formylglutamate amidohydrolase n=1 Tax=Aurantiacibacter sediminis TaxID=2793064 RepID=A0ABS0N4P8_9SPHN|nr:N-formylglutamate amidohydrolase [Aurantiacibacter sediminis]MBH5322304.1 N-formylglutamate amidohydrolase [Aurantiacibacter sediminis]
MAGYIPGKQGVPAFSLRQPRPGAIPILIAVPHAGRDYPAALCERMRAPEETALRLEDRLVDLVGKAVAEETGAALLTANAPRAMIDLNRSPDDIDWQMVATADRPLGKRLAAGRRARSGLGLVPRRLPGMGELWTGLMRGEELKERIEAIHQPYHVALAKSLESIRDRWGAALLIDLHSMPPLGPKSGPNAAVDFVIGDRFGASCDSGLIAAAFERFDRRHARAAHNRPYAGGYVLDRHGAPNRRINAMQLEVCRAAYLDNRLQEPGDGLEQVVDMVAFLVRGLAEQLAGSTRNFSQAAE